MATLFGIDCKQSSGFIGLEPCYVEPGPLLGHIKLVGRPTFDTATTTPNKAFFLNLVQQGQAYFIVDAFGSPTETAAPTLETSDITLRSVVVNRALPMVTTTLKMPYEYQKGFYKLRSQDQDSVILVYQNVIKVCVSVDGLSWGGFNVGMYEPMTYAEATGSTKAQVQVMYQITDLDGYNTRGAYLYNLDFAPNTEINNVTGVYMTGRADVSDNKLYVKPTWLQNDLSPILGLDVAQFRARLNGSANVITLSAFNSSTGEYALTPTTAVSLASQSWVVDLYDATASPPVAVAKLGTVKPKLYAGSTPAFVPEA